MSDAFSDLWQSSNQAQTKSKQTLGAAQVQQTASSLPWAHQAAKSDAFTILASASAAPSRTITPARSPIPPQPAARNGDSFADLVSFGPSSKASNSSSMSLAAQQARPTSSQSKPVLPPPESNTLWGQLDILGSSTAPTKPTPSAMQSSDPWDIDFIGASPPAHKLQPTVQRPVTTGSNKQAPTTSANVFDLLGDFDGTVEVATPASSVQSRSTLEPTSSLVSVEPPRSSTPGDFDFGDREHSNMDNDDDDDILGMLAKPVRAVSKRTSPEPSDRIPPDNSLRTTTASSSGRISPPPHLIGQIVEMGFSVEQARVALAATSTGLDVPAALETLLQSGETEQASSSFRDDHGSEDEREREQERERERKRRLQHERRRRPELSSRDSDLGDGAVSVAAQADKILAQATELGISMFTKANTFWNAGKERVQKVYEERATASGRPSTSASPAPGKGNVPRWMQENTEDDMTSPVDAAPPAFKDASDDEFHTSVRAQTSPQSQPRPAPIRASSSNSLSSNHLFVDESRPAGGYRSPFRGGAKTSQSATPQPSRGPSPRLTAVPSFPPPPSFPGTSPSVLATVAAHKAKANETFKLGSYPAAITSYTTALDLLPAQHMTRVSLLNNRALASIRIGEWKSAIDDCSAALSLIRASASGGAPPYLGPVPTPGTLTDGTNLPGETLHLGDALLKALSRRAAAYEMGEKWPSALADWEATQASALLPMSTGGSDIGKSRSEATRGVERCKKMVGIVSGALSERTQAAPAPVSRPVRRPAPQSSTSTAPPSEAVQRLRAANAAASAEEQTKSEYKDTVDSRLQTWKSGKETNIRALIASLDSVLWPELGWQTVGMAELITPKQLKVRYMKAIAKLHPDKLNVENTTVEQRMIANGVFATLNEAWVASNI